MKKTIAILLALAALAPCAIAGTNDVITNYFAGYVYVPASTTNAGSTGLTVSNAYLCFPASLFSITATQAATATGDVRAVMYSLGQEYYDSREALAAANQSASTIARDTRYTTSGTGVLETVTHVLKTIRQLSSPAYP